MTSLPTAPLLPPPREPSIPEKRHKASPPRAKGKSATARGTRVSPPSRGGAKGGGGEAVGVYEPDADGSPARARARERWEEEEEEAAGRAGRGEGSGGRVGGGEEGGQRG
ncbi:hypothetical protein T484DRAFT_1909481, partial [Baffinella frigidus]